MNWSGVWDNVDWDIYAKYLYGNNSELADEFNKMTSNVCKNAEPTNLCAQTACIVEANFISSFEKIYNMYLMTHQGALNDEFLHTNGFSVSDNCPTTRSPTQSEKSCCGDYPKRFPFKSFAGEHACCGSKTYNTNVLCCDQENELSFQC